MLDSLESYKVLDLEPGASAERVRRSYIELAHVWDPSRYEDNPVLREHAKQKWDEINDAYKSLCTFLPDLRGDIETIEFSDLPQRDFNELAHHVPAEKSRAFLGILAAIVIFMTFIFACSILLKGRQATPSIVPLAAHVE